MIEYLAKTLKKMKDCYGVGSQVGRFAPDLGGSCARSLREVTQGRLLKGVENTQQKRDVQLFVKGRVLWKNPTYHQLEH
jgi:bacterioferritin-associated ferredoxin